MKKIMIVEDEKVICEELCALLKNAGYEAEIRSIDKTAKEEEDQLRSY